MALDDTDISVSFRGPYPTNISFENYRTDELTFVVGKEFKLYENAKVTFETHYHETRVEAWNSLNFLN